MWWLAVGKVSYSQSKYNTTVILNDEGETNPTSGKLLLPLIVPPGGIHPDFTILEHKHRYKKEMKAQ